MAHVIRSLQRMALKTIRLSCPQRLTTQYSPPSLRIIFFITTKKFIFSGTQRPTNEEEHSHKSDRSPLFGFGAAATTFAAVGIATGMLLLLKKCSHSK